jgi:hypothetical protein
MNRRNLSRRCRPTNQRRIHNLPPHCQPTHRHNRSRRCGQRTKRATPRRVPLLSCHKGSEKQRQRRRRTCRGAALCYNARGYHPSFRTEPKLSHTRNTHTNARRARAPIPIPTHGPTHFQTANDCILSRVLPALPARVTARPPAPTSTSELLMSPWSSVQLARQLCWSLTVRRQRV